MGPGEAPGSLGLGAGRYFDLNCVGSQGSRVPWLEVVAEDGVCVGDHAFAEEKPRGQGEIIPWSPHRQQALVTDLDEEGFLTDQFVCLPVVQVAWGGARMLRNLAHHAWDHSRRGG